MRLRKQITDKVSYFLLGSVGYDCDDDLLDKALSRTSMNGNFFKCLGLLGGHYLDKLVTIFLHASCSSISTCPGADYSKEKEQIRKNKKVAIIVEIEIVLKGSDINNVIMIHD